MDSIKELRSYDRNLGVFLLTIITKQSIEINTKVNPYLLLDKKSYICSQYNDSLFLSLYSNDVFNDNLIKGKVVKNYVFIKITFNYT